MKEAAATTGGGGVGGGHAEEAHGDVVERGAEHGGGGLGVEAPAAVFLLVVAQFRSYLVPVIIMMPIPLTIIGVMPGHALFGAQFTATSMIGMIALAGIIVRNSILLVDFINQELAAGRPFDEAVIRSGAVRSWPEATGLCGAQANDGPHRGGADRSRLDGIGRRVRVPGCDVTKRSGYKG